MERTIDVEGMSSVEVPCDRVKFTLQVSEEDVDAEKAIDLAKGAMTDFLNKIPLHFSACIDWADVQLDVLTEHDDSRGSRRNQAEPQTVCRATQEVEVSMPWDVYKLSEALMLLWMNKTVEPQFITAYVADTYMHQREATREAVRNATEYAKLLCEATGVKLGKLISINKPEERRGLDNEEEIEPELSVEDLLISTQLDELSEDDYRNNDTGYVVDHTVSVMAKHLVKQQEYATFCDHVHLQFEIIE